MPTWMNLKDIILSERCQTQGPHVVRTHFYEVPRTDKPTETESRIEVSKGSEEKERGFIV